MIWKKQMYRLLPGENTMKQNNMQWGWTTMEPLAYYYTLEVNRVYVLDVRQVLASALWCAKRLHGSNWALQTHVAVLLGDLGAQSGPFPSDFQGQMRSKSKILTGAHSAPHSWTSMLY
jgi:hypothetical protein